MSEAVDSQIKTSQQAKKNQKLKKSKKPKTNWIASKLRNFFGPRSLSINLLALFSTLATGLLSFAGAIALGFSFPLAIAAFALTALVSLQVNIEMIENAINKLLKFFNNHKKPIKNTLYILAAVLSALSFSATTLLSAVALFPFSTAIVIAAVSAVAWFFVSYQILRDAHKLFAKFKEKLTNFYNGLKERHFLIRALIILVAITLVLAAAYYIVATATTWWLETKLGLLLLMPIGVATAITLATAPLNFLTHALFTITNPLLALFKFSRNKFESGFLQHIKNKPELKLNPFYLLNTAIAAATSFLLFLAHSACHALMASRTSVVTISGTYLDFFADANFTIARDNSGKTEQTDAAQEKKHTHDHSEHDHGHEPFDFIVMLTQTIVTLPIQLLSYPLTVIISFFKYPNKSLGEVFAHSYKECFYFIDNYIKSKQEHHHHHHHENEPHKASATCSSDSTSSYSDSVSMAISAPEKLITPRRDSLSSKASSDSDTIANAKQSYSKAPTPVAA